MEDRNEALVHCSTMLILAFSIDVPESSKTNQRKDVDKHQAVHKHPTEG